MRIRTFLMASAAIVATALPAFADDAAIEKRLEAMEKKIEAQDRQIETQRKEIGVLKHALRRKGVKVAPDTALAASPPSQVPLAPPPGREAQIEKRLEDLETAQNDAKLAKQDSPNVSLAGGRPTITSADGRFSASIRLLGQYDVGYYMQSARAVQLAAANGPDLSSGSNFRRAQLGLQGVLFGDWAYNFNYEFGSGVSSGNELQGRIQQAFIEYDGLAPWAFRIGAFPPAAGLEDSTSAADTMFLERNSPADVVRNLAGGDGRDAAGITYATDRVFGSAVLTGGKVADSNLYFDEQQAVVARFSGIVYSDPDTKVLLSGAGTDVFRGPDAAAGPGSARNITLSDPPEVNIDDNSTKLVSTGAINADSAWAWGVEGAAQWRSLFAQGGYFGYGIDQRTAGKPELNFNGWYAQASWVLTGESKGYNTSNGAFASPKPRIPFSFDGGGFGAIELAARYSDLDLNDHAGALGQALPANGVRGGEQQIFTAALSWYPVSALKFSMQAQNVHINRIGTIPAGFGHGTLNNANVGQVFNTVALRSQLSL